MSARKNKKLAKFCAVVFVLTAVNQLGASGYNLPNGARFLWRKLDRQVTTALATFP